MSAALPTPLVDAAWLLAHRDDPDLVVLDATWHLPKQERDGAAEWRQRRIPGSRHFDYDRVVCDPDTPLPRMLPSAAAFTTAARALGIDAASRIVVYDTNDLFSSPRAWWMFRAMGHDAVTVLDGGLQAWIDAGGPLADGEPAAPPPGDFRAQLCPDRFIDATATLAYSQAGDAILDARDAERFVAAHIPGSANQPYTSLLREGRLLPPEALREAFGDRLPGAAEPLICTCGSAVTACVVALAADRIGHRDIRVYDGSWTEWGARDDLPKESGTAD